MAWEGTERICLAAAGGWWSLDSAVINQASCNQPPDRYSTNRKYKLFLPSMLGQDGFIITLSNQTVRYTDNYFISDTDQRLVPVPEDHRG